MTGKVKFFRLTGLNQTELTIVLRDLKNWIAEKSILQTQLGNNGQLRTFCCSVFENNSQFIISTWNENFSDNGKIYTLSALCKTGFSLKSSELPIKHYSIAGYPGFFWIIPERGIIGVLEFWNKVNGKANFENYLNEFLSFFSTQITDNKKFIQLKLQVMHDDNSLDFILQNHHQICKIIKSGIFLFQKEQPCEIWQSFIRFLGGFEQTNLIEDAQKISLELNITPSLKTLKKIIHNWKKESCNNPTTELAFKFKGNNKIYRLGKTKLERVINCQFSSGNCNVIPDVREILHELQTQINVDNLQVNK